MSNKPSLNICGRMVGDDHPPLVIAEIGINHEGSLNTAFELIDAAISAGAEVIKHQTHVVEDEMSFDDTPQNDIHWASEETCASDHCSFFTNDYATFNFFSAGGDISFWQEWHSGTDNLDFMVTKAGGEDNLGDGFNTLVWTSLNLFIHIDNTDDSFQGRWYSAPAEE